MRAINVDVCGTVSSCVLDGRTGWGLAGQITDVLGAEHYDVISFGDGVDLLVDAEGATTADRTTRQRFNPVLSNMAHGVGHTAIFHGPGLFLGHNVDGNIVGLTDEQVERIVLGWSKASKYPAVRAAELLTH